MPTPKKVLEYSVLYQFRKDLVLFDFTCDDETFGEDLHELIIFHFTDRHDLEERVNLCANTIFKDFYDSEDEELIDYALKID
jgi:hypothetical protein